jgi:hypothetical protein
MMKAATKLTKKPRLSKSVVGGTTNFEGGNVAHVMPRLLCQPLQTRRAPIDVKNMTNTMASRT